MDRAKLTDFISDERLAEIVKAEREGRLQFRKRPPEATCGSCLYFLRNPGKAGGKCGKKTEPLQYYGQPPKLVTVYQSTKICKKHFKPREEKA